MKEEESYLIRRGCDAKQLASHCVRADESPPRNPELMFIRTLAYEQRWKFIGEILRRHRRGESPKAIAEIMNVKRKTVQQVIHNHYQFSSAAR